VSEPNQTYLYIVPVNHHLLVHSLSSFLHRSAPRPPMNLPKGPSIKYVTLKGEGSENETVCDRGRGQEHVTSHLYKFLSYIRNMKFKVMFNFML